MLIRILKILGAGIGILLLLFVGAIGWFVIQANKHNSAALAQAQEVCDTLPTGEIPPEFQAIAEQRGGVYFDDDTGRHTLAFHGYVYDHAECRVMVEDGLVISKEVLMVHE